MERDMHFRADMDQTAEDLKVRTKRFAIAVLDFIETLPRTVAGDALARQLTRAGMGVAGNYRAACRGRSHTEFTSKLGVVLEEADESELWFEIAAERNMGERSQRDRLLDESSQLRAIFSKACTTARNRERARRSALGAVLLFFLHFLPAILQS
jgi:four helix bundle protein